MFPINISGQGICDASMVRFPPDMGKALIQRPLRHHPQPAHAHTPDMRAAMAGLSFGAMNAAGFKSFPGLPIGHIPGTMPPAAAASLSSSLVPYPASPYTSLALSTYAQSAELRNLSLCHAAGRSQLPNEMEKIKTPIINRNYLELAMLVCNTFRGKLFPCTHCRYVTDRRNNLKRHISTMHQACEKRLECCGVSFGTKASLREHIMIFHHNGYSCPYCGRRFCRKALLKRHLSVHSGQKDFNCPSCDYATSHKSNLERHKRIHDRLRLGDDTAMFPCDEMSSPSRQSPDTTDDSCIDIDITDDNDDHDDHDDTIDTKDVTEHSFHSVSSHSETPKLNQTENDSKSHTDVIDNRFKPINDKDDYSDIAKRLYSFPFHLQNVHQRHVADNVTQSVPESRRSFTMGREASEYRTATGTGSCDSSVIIDPNVPLNLQTHPTSG